jgi:hypothetical protein
MSHTPSSNALLLDEKAGAGQREIAVDRYQVLKHSALVLALIAVTINVATILAYWSGVPTAH